MSVALGVGLVGFVELSQEGQGSTKALRGLLFGLGSLVTTGIQYVVEERVLSKYFFHPLRLVGFEGLWGILLGAVAMAIAHFIPCSSASEFCNNGTFENLGNAVSFIFGDVHLLLLIIIALINSSFFNFFGISITKHVSPMTRTTISVLVTCIVWVYSMIWLGHKFYILQLIGFVFIVLGNLIYQEIVEIPGLNNNTRKNQERRALFNESLAIEDDDD
jgi:drug/metabolite transporter (DMT)-like permease